MTCFSCVGCFCENICNEDSGGVGWGINAKLSTPPPWFQPCDLLINLCKLPDAQLRSLLPWYIKPRETVQCFRRKRVAVFSNPEEKSHDLPSLSVALAESKYTIQVQHVT